MIMRDYQGGCSQDNPPDIQVRGVTHRAAKRCIRVELSGSIILYDMYQIITQINDGIILGIIRKQGARQGCYITTPPPAETSPSH